MADYTCEACNTKQSRGGVRQCNKCRRVLCDSCKGPRSACSDSKHGTANCSGIYLRIYAQPG